MVSFDKIAIYVSTLRYAIVLFAARCLDIYWKLIGVIIISSFQSIMEGFDFSYLLGLLMGIVPSLICITLHELSHGLVAYSLGDDTAKKMGRLSLNPLKHLDPMGMLMMLVFHFGWAKPVPVNMYRFKNPRRGMAVTALAGPLSNILAALVFLFIYGFSLVPLCRSEAGMYIHKMIELTAYISVGLAVFNLIPVPPLDGSKVLFSLVRDETYYKLMRYERYGSLIMFALVAAGVFGKPLSRLISGIFVFMTPVGQAGLDLYIRIFI